MQSHCKFVRRLLKLVILYTAMSLHEDIEHETSDVIAPLGILHRFKRAPSYSFGSR